MTLHYGHRRQLQQMLATAQSLAAIARALGVHRSTVKRELDRNGEADGSYCADKAEKKAHLRRVIGGVKSFHNRKPMPMPRGGKAPVKNRYRKKYLNLPLKYQRWKSRKGRITHWYWDLRKYRRRFVSFGQLQKIQRRNADRQRDWWQLYRENAKRYFLGLFRYEPKPTGLGKAVLQKGIRLYITRKLSRFQNCRQQQVVAVATCPRPVQLQNEKSATMMEVLVTPFFLGTSPLWRSNHTTNKEVDAVSLFLALLFYVYKGTVPTGATIFEGNIPFQ
ncbi:helix-turn-helix domain-containing protein [Limibacter armeniacum]|uniref:helix-turn-helix domain-containing protein n=1 Tax=Limibacter armeniacum TaxID=466084 RepID=UPI002FE55731